MSGQPVSFDLIEWPKWIYDTDPACRAVVAMRQLQPDAALGYFETLQHGFYRENRDLTDTAVLLELAEPIDCDKAEFADLIAQQDLAESDYAEARALGAGGFPYLILDTGTEMVPVSVGFSRAENILRKINTLTASTPD